MERAKRKCLGCLVKLILIDRKLQMKTYRNSQTRNISIIITVSPAQFSRIFFLQWTIIRSFRSGHFGECLQNKKIQPLGANH